jgi:hypothetical protein
LGEARKGDADEAAQKWADGRRDEAPMTTAPILLLYAATAGLGGYILLLWFRQARRPVLIGFHLILGAASLETLFVFLRNSGLDSHGSASRLGMIAGGFMAIAMFSGFTAPLLGKNYRTAANSLLATHVCSGIAGFLIVLAFMAKV